MSRAVRVAQAVALDQLVHRHHGAVDGEVERSDDLVRLGVDRRGDRAQAVRELLVVDRDPRLADAVELPPEAPRVSQGVRPARGEVDLVEELLDPLLGEERDDCLAHCGAVGGKASADMEVQIDVALPRA